MKLITFRGKIWVCIKNHGLLLNSKQRNAYFRELLIFCFNMRFKPGGKRYKDYPTFFRTLFDERVQKLSIDGGFTCPNRDGSKGGGGCTFCNNESFNPGYCRAVSGISRQIGEGRAFFARKYIGQKYLAYFQAYSNTYAPLEELRQKYEEALDCPDVVGLVIATRPDAVTDDVLDYIAGLSRRCYVCVEYGVESANDEVLRTVNRGHTFAEAEEAKVQFTNETPKFIV